MTSRPPRLLILTAAGAIGGTERVALGLARQFGARGWHVRAAFADNPEAAAMLCWAREQGVEAVVTPAMLPMSLHRGPADMVALWKFVRAARPDIVNLHYGGNHISVKDVLAVRCAGVRRCVVNVHHPTPWSETSPRTKDLTRLAARASSAMIVPSREVRRVLMEARIPERKIRVVHNGVPLPRSFPSRDDARRVLGIEPGAFVIGSLGRLAPVKAMPDLIEAVARIPDPSRQIRLLIAGDGPDRAEIEDLAAARLPGRASVLGPLPDTAEFLAALDVFALASKMEGFGLVYVEAAFHGVPSVGTDVGGTRDAIADGETGLLVAPESHEAMAHAIERLRADAVTRCALGEAARARAHREFTEEIMANQYEKVFLP